MHGTQLRQPAPIAQQRTNEGVSIMEKFTITTATVKTLQAEGYSVQLNGIANVPLSECRSPVSTDCPIQLTRQAGSTQHSSLPSTSTYLAHQMTSTWEQILALAGWLDCVPRTTGNSVTPRPRGGIGEGTVTTAGGPADVVSPQTPGADPSSPSAFRPNSTPTQTIRSLEPNRGAHHAVDSSHDCRHH
jgi:hypothetical protein